MVITIYWLYRGLRRGLYPALNMLMVFFVPLLITVNYYDLFFGVVAWISSGTSNTTREMFSFIAMYALTFGLAVYLCVWRCADVMRIHKVVDIVGGGICGAATGIVCSGVLAIMWSTVPVSEEKFSPDDSQMFFPTAKLTMRAATFIGRRIPAERPFIGDRFVRDLRFGLPQIPTTGAGIYVSSVPTGLRVFTDSSGLAPVKFLEKITERIDKPQDEVRASEARLPFGEKRRTPVYVPEDAQKILVAVIMDVVPPEIAEKADESEMFVHDGETYYSLVKIADRKLFVKIYRVTRESGVVPVIALFQPADPQLDDRFTLSFLPSRECFVKRDDSTTRNRLRADLAREGVSDRMDDVLQQLCFGGKVWFQGPGGAPKYCEIIGDGKWRFGDGTPPDREAVKKETGATWYTPKMW